MKFTNRSFSFPKVILTVLLFSPGALSQAAPLVLIDGTADGGYTLNGSFESPGGGGFQTVPDNWTAVSTSTPVSGVVEARNNTASDGSYSGLIGADSSSANFNLITDTFQTGNYTIGLGDSYTLSFEHIGLLNWDDGIDEIRYSLFYTADNTLTGVTYQAPGSGSGLILGATATVLFSDAITVDLTWGSTGSINTAAVSDGGAVGQHLFLAFTSAGASGEYARVDEVNLSVTVVPEPGSMVLVLAGMASIVLLARKRSR